jgi:hypothetical protein
MLLSAIKFSAHTSREARPLAEFWFDRWRAVDVESQLFFSPLENYRRLKKKVAGPIRKARGNFKRKLTNNL